MIVKLLGLIDIICASSLLLMRWDLHPYLALGCAAYLIIKSLLFIKDIASWVDIFAGIFLVLAFFGLYPAVNYLFIIWLLQKGLRSLL